MNHRHTTINIDGVVANRDWKRLGLVTRMYLLIAIRDMVLMEAYTRKIEENAPTKQPASPNCQPPVISVTSTNIPLVRKLRMSVIARATMYMGVIFRKTGFR